MRGARPRPRRLTAFEGPGSGWDLRRFGLGYGQPGMQLGDYAAVLGVWIVALAAPGPDVVLVLRQTVRGGRPAGVAAAAGIALGIVAWIALAMLGAHVLVEADDRVLGALQVAGGAYLIALGIAGVRAALTPGGAHEFELADLEADGRANDVSPVASLARRSLLLGLATNLSNPKALVFFGTVFTVLIPAEADTAERAALSVLLVAIEAAWFGGLALLTSSAKAATFLGRHAATLDAVAAVAFIVLGGVSLVSGASAFL